MAQHVRGFLDELPRHALGPTWRATLVLTLANCADAVEVGVISYVLLVLQLTEFERSFLSAAVFFDLALAAAVTFAFAVAAAITFAVTLAAAITFAFAATANGGPRYYALRVPHHHGHTGV